MRDDIIHDIQEQVGELSCIDAIAFLVTVKQEIKELLKEQERRLVEEEDEEPRSKWDREREDYDVD